MTRCIPPIPFYSAVLLLIFLFPVSVFSQVEPDPSRSGGLGRVIPLPGTSLYAGDFPQETEIFESGPTYHTFGGWFAPQVDWGRVGRLGNSPSLLFDGIPAPLSSIRALNWMPVGGSAQFFDFPAEAFWGRESAAGALQITPLGFQDRDRAIGSLWGGSGISGGGSFLYQGSSFSVDGNLRHAVPFGTDGTNTFDLLSRTRWVQSEDFTLEDSLLATQLFPEDYWYAVNTSLKLMSPNFQSVEIRPFYQTSRMSGQDYQEYGSLLNYHFSLAGLAESHIGAGYSRFQTYDSDDWLEKGFIQTTDFGDILGPINLNVALRMDFQSFLKPVFSDSVGCQATDGSITYLGDYSKGVLPLNQMDSQQIDLGFRLQPGENWTAALKYIHDQVGNTPWNGGRFNFQYNSQNVLKFLYRVQVSFTKQVLFSGDGSMAWDTEGELVLHILRQTNFYIRGREITGGNLDIEIGGEISPIKNVMIFASVGNLSDLSVAWPDQDTPFGRVLWLGTRGYF